MPPAYRKSQSRFSQFITMFSSSIAAPLDPPPPTLLELIDLIDKFSIGHSTCIVIPTNTLFSVPAGFPVNNDNYFPLLIGDDPRPHGFVLCSIATILPWPHAFQITDSAIHLRASTAAEATAAFQLLINATRNVDPIGKSIALPSEHFLLPGQPFLGETVHIERFASSIFGIGTRGSHMTAYVRGPSGEPDDILIWVARRSPDLFSYPHKLDSTVAGGVKASDTPLECIIAESEEEASLPRELVQARVKHTGVVTLANRNPRNGFFHGEILYVYDLELTADEKPELGYDGEVCEFILMTWREVLGRMQNLEFKPNVCPIMIDFFMRHGLITPDNEPRYVEISSRLRRKLPMATNEFEGR
ncbi:hypothetical protein VHEMI00812 [[Torrubiella] hemipterigena]|uniref:Nudix hydrolase domain-containing protein n=1 Tax=[Torrubiella] hemipterigena TaxID=1531966 RepID=A0A0A1T332_9HYPO|nr:hypothetical protein VHEMI00812 [[Torrubiella] hemipterigena]